VVAELAEDLDTVCFIGDDIGDLPAFDVVRARRGVTIAVRSDESPPELLAAADLVVDGPEGALQFLSGLL
jgi:trehalose 6-phosphate phosphatase